MPTEGTPSLRESFRTHLRERTLEAAYAETVAKGWDKVRVGQVAENVGTSRAMVYKEFGDKQGLGEALVLHESERFLVGIQKVLADQDDLSDRMRDGRGRRRRDPCLGRLHAGPGRGEPPAARDARDPPRARPSGPGPPRPPREPCPC